MHTLPTEYSAADAAGYTHTGKDYPTHSPSSPSPSPSPSPPPSSSPSPLPSSSLSSSTSPRPPPPFTASPLPLLLLLLLLLLLPLLFSFLSFPLHQIVIQTRIHFMFPFSWAHTYTTMCPSFCGSESGKRWWYKDSLLKRVFGGVFHM